MAEELLLSGTGEILNSQISIALDEIGLVCVVKSVVKTARNLLTKIQSVLRDAEKRQLQDSAVKHWLKELKDVAYDAEDVLNAIGYENLRRRMENKVRNFFSVSNPIAFHVSVAHKIKDVNRRLEGIEKDKERFVFHSVPVNFLMPGTSSSSSIV